MSQAYNIITDVEAAPAFLKYKKASVTGFYGDVQKSYE